MGNKLNNLRMILTLFHVGFSGFILYSVQQKQVIQDLCLLLLAYFAFLGNYFKTIKPNYFIGIKTPWTLENERGLEKKHIY